jgi:hypothetical protein
MGPNTVRSGQDQKQIRAGQRAIFTLNRERVPLAFQAGHAGSIPVTRSTENPLRSKVFRATTAAPLVVKRRFWVPSGDVRAAAPPTALITREVPALR